MKPLICDSCKKRVSKLTYKPREGVSLCESCNETAPQTCFGVSVIPADGVFLEHVSSKGKRFFSKHEMKEYEKRHDYYIDCAH